MFQRKSKSNDIEEIPSGKLPIPRELLQKEIANPDNDFARSKKFMVYLFQHGTKALDGEGLDKQELLKLIDSFNKKYPKDIVVFNKPTFNHLAGKLGQLLSINRNELLLGMGLTDQVLAFEHSKPFLKYLSNYVQSKKELERLAINDVINIADMWNQKHLNDPAAWVKVSKNGFLKIALLESSANSQAGTTIGRTELAAALSGKTSSLNNPGALSQWQKHWPASIPFTYKAFQSALDNGYSNVLLQNGRRSISIDEAINLVSRETWVTSFKSAFNQNQIEEKKYEALNPFKETKDHYEPKLEKAKELKAMIALQVKDQEKVVGHKLSSEERAHFLKGLQSDEMIGYFAGIPASLYENLTGLGRSQAPYAFAALSVLGSVISTPAQAAKQNSLLSGNVARYLRDVVVNSPETCADVLRSLNALQSDISGPERFQRSLLLLGAVVGLKSSLKSYPKIASKVSRAVDTLCPDSVVERAVLKEWTGEALGTLKSAAQREPTGKAAMNLAHIEAQIEKLQTYKQWFDQKKKLGFDIKQVEAAIAGSDLTKYTPDNTALWSEKATKNPQFKEQIAYGPGNLSPHASPLHNLFLHAQGGAGQAFVRLVDIGKKRGLSQQASEALALKVAGHITGHDSFGAGFGQQTLKPALSKLAKVEESTLQYPASKTPAGFIVQLMDRMDGLTEKTLLRKVLEGKERGLNLQLSIKSAFVEETAWSKNILSKMRQDAKAHLTPEQYKAFIESPMFQDYNRRLFAIKELVELKGPIDDGLHIVLKKKTYKVTTFEGFEKVFQKVFQLK